MTTEDSHNLPKHLVPLIQATPSGALKLIAAWDGLSVESQIAILAALEEAESAGINWWGPIYVKAVQSANVYIRYLAARRLRFGFKKDDQDNPIKLRIETDPDPLVRYSLFEVSSFDAILDDWAKELADPIAFFNLPHPARLARVRCLGGDSSSAGRVAKLVAHAVDHDLKEGTISPLELFEILSDYLKRPEFKSEFTRERNTYDGYGGYLHRQALGALWHLVPKLPEPVSLVLIENLPPILDERSVIPDEVLQGMTDLQLGTLFRRRDVGLSQLRKKAFFDSDEQRDLLRCYAITYNFDLEYEEFKQILSRPDLEKMRALRQLASGAFDLSLCLYEAIHDVLYLSEGLFDFEEAWFAQSALKRKLSTLQGWQREKQVLELRLYRLAKNAVPWKHEEVGTPPSDQLAFLSKSLVARDTWATFMAFSVAWANMRYSHHVAGTDRVSMKFEELLPSLDDAIQTGQDKVADLTELSNRIEAISSRLGEITENVAELQERLTRH